MKLNVLYDSIDSKEEFIKTPLDLIYEFDIELTSEQFMDVLNYIVKHNKKYLLKIKKEQLELQRILEQTNVKEEHKEQEEQKTNFLYATKVHKDYNDKLDLIFFTIEENELNNIINQLSSNEIINLKLLILKRINEKKLQIKETLLNNPIKDIKINQEDIQRYEYLLTKLTESKEIEEDIEETYDSKIILLPYKNSSYLCEDIKEYIDGNRDLLNAFTKIINGYFLQSKDTKSIVKYDKLNEYKNPNGLRVMYVTMPNGYIAICSLFFKDKQKSSKIESYYEEAITRFREQKKYIEENLNNPDFMINQSILVGQIYSLLDSDYTLKKVGE